LRPASPPWQPLLPSRRRRRTRRLGKQRLVPGPMPGKVADSGTGRPGLAVPLRLPTVIPMRERLQKIIARAGIASRRHAAQLILSGQVRVNGRVVTELGSKADPRRDHIEAAGRQVRSAEPKTYFMLHKPPQVVSTLADPEGRRTLRHFLSGVRERVFPVGRLDYAVSGLLLLTNDGELASRILKAAGRLPQTYWIKVKGRLAVEERRY